MDKEIVFGGYCPCRGLNTITRSQAKRLTHLFVAFGTVQDCRINGSEVYRQKHEIERIRSYNPELAIILSTGGGGAGGHSEATRPENLAGFVESTMDVVRGLDLDGIDCDWEFPKTAEEREQHIALIRAYRKEIDAYQTMHPRRCWLSIAAACWDRFYAYVDIVEIAKYLDFINLMTYDLRDKARTDSYTGHHTNLYDPKLYQGQGYKISTDTAVNRLINMGIPKDQIVIGAAFYSHRFFNVPDINHGFGLKVDELHDYGPDYTGVRLIYEKDPEFVKYWDDDAKAAYLFNGNELITYDDPRSVAHKARYVHEKGIRGIMYWEHSGDQTGTLFEAIYENLF